MMGVRTPQQLLERVPAEMKATVTQDLISSAKIIEMLGHGTASERELFEAGCHTSQSMFVIRLLDSQLLLYNPCRLHYSLVSWLISLGEVGWIVSGSSFQTTHLPAVAKKFPQAVLVASTPVEEKCRVRHKFRGLDFDCLIKDGPRGIQSANVRLRRVGAQLHFVEGDVLTNSIVLTARGILFETDLLYANATFDRLAGVDAERWMFDPSLFLERIYFYRFFTRWGNTQQLGGLPCFQYLAHDPDSGWAVALTAQNPEGNRSTSSASSKMAAALRRILSLEFTQAVSAHQLNNGPMAADEFKLCINNAWQWLDGRSLLGMAEPCESLHRAAV
uniref:Uncharacterized protein n=1 Tax=Calcidiscus leptoporus TaxID=127549 RepID=A0A7S0NPW2_9EUKA